MSLETRLNDSLKDILKTSGYMFEIVNNNKKQSNIITGDNNQLISQPIVHQLAKNLAKFNEILDDTVSKCNDVHWMVEETMSRKQQEAELRMKEQMEKQRLQEEARRQQEARQQEARQQEAREQEARRQAEEKRKWQKQQQKSEKERLEKERIENERLEKERGEQERKAREAREAEASLAEFNQPFDFDLSNPGGLGIPNPTDILSTINYPDQPPDGLMNDILENDDLLLGGLNMELMDQGLDSTAPGGQMTLDDGFDVDNFLNQFDS